jgi:hypothetical protein
VVLQVVTNVSEEHVASIFSVTTEKTTIDIFTVSYFMDYENEEERRSCEVWDHI